MALVVYGVARSGHPVPPGVTGIGEPPGEVRLVGTGPVAAVVSSVPDDLVLRDQDAVTYLEALTALLPGGPVLPVRFATLVADEDEARRELLDTAVDDLVELLGEMDGLVEIRLETAVNEEVEIARLLDATPDLRRLAQRMTGPDAEPADRIRLGEEISLRLAERRDELGDDIRAQLENVTVAYAPCRPGEYTALRQAYLVPASGLARFDAAVHAVRAGLGPEYTVRSVGPLPPFDFTDVRPRPAGTGQWGWD
nr:GvpL/GvpF family gas vesicle protein [uncultured Actinoplanes sp.]